MATNDDTHPQAPAGGPGTVRSVTPGVSNPGKDRWTSPGVLGVNPPLLNIHGDIVAGGPLSPGTVVAVNAAAAKVPPKWHRYIAYADKVKVGGSLAWRANNPGNLRGASTKIGTVPGGTGRFAVFATLEEGRAAQRDLYLSKYGDVSVHDAIYKLTPPSENKTEHYLAELKASGVDLDKTVQSQIDTLMPAVKKNEGLIPGVEVGRIP